jgi:hypothetical protein
LDDFVTAYADNILIYSFGSFEDHRQKVQNVLQKLINAGLQADIQKSEFKTYEIKYLGYIINSKKGIFIDSEKIRAIKNWAVLTNVKAVRSFIGFANFYRMFIPTYSNIIRPLVDLTKKNKEFHWNEKCNKAFEKLKELMIIDPILAHFHPERETILEADSLEYATEGLLLQKNEKGWWKPVAYYSKKHDTAKMNYPIHDKELLAIINCIKAWKPEFKAVKSFKILTNHRNLRYFYTKKQLTERQIR